jgi:hypothetical protein
MHSFLKNLSFPKIVIFGVVAAGILIALVQFLANRELLLDESRLIFNINDRGFAGLMKPLDYLQVAPILFLWIEKILSFICPTSEYVFRVFPFLCFTATFFFFLKLLNRYVKDKYAIVFILAFYTFNNLVLWYASAQAKQYMSDVLVLLTIYYVIAVKEFKSDKTKLWLLGILGTAFIFLSNVAPIILFTAGFYLFYEEFFVTKKKRVLPYIPVFTAWLAAFAVYYFNFIADHPTYDFMADYWDYTFFPFYSFSKACHFIVERSQCILSFFFPYSTPLFLKMSIPAIGLAGLIWKRQIKLLILVFVPILVHLILSGFRLYPFDLRLMLYLFPCITLLIGMGVFYIAKFVLSFVNPVFFKICAVFVPVVLMIYYIGFCRPHQRHRELKETMEFVNANINEGENIYLHYFTICRYVFYSQKGDLDNMKKCPATRGQWTDFYAYKRGDIRELDKMKGKTWFLISGGSDEVLILNRLDSLGHKKLKEFHFVEGDWEGRGDSAAYLFDCGE